MSYEEESVAILDREVRKLRSREIASIKVHWKNRPVEVLKRVGEVAYELALPPGLSGVHPVFHVSMLKRYHGDGNYISVGIQFCLMRTCLMRRSLLLF